MYVNLRASNGTEYFSINEREIDWDENDATKVSVKQLDDLEEILATEASIFLLRRATGIDGATTDTMATMRTKLIKQYEANYEPYISYNEFY